MATNFYCDWYRQKMNLRDYQWEVIGPAIDGQNIIIWLPSGTGKTRAAVYVAMRHLETKRDAKVAMIVNKVHLVHDHFIKEFQPSLGARFKITPISGDSERSSYFAEFVKKSHIVICTAHVLYSAILSDSVDRHVEMSDFTLLIMDDCHHTQNDVIYNKLMDIYLEIKIDWHRRLPQILGLTAFPVAGGASTFENAVNYILMICANLDTWKIMSPKTLVKAPDARMKQPCRQYNLVAKRVVDPFGDKLKQLMTAIHDYMGDTEYRANFGTQEYEQNVVLMEKSGAEADDIRKKTCAGHLRKYNDALLIHDTVRMRDAYNFLDEFYVVEGFYKQRRDETDVFLYRLFNEYSTGLLELCRITRYENPKLKMLEEILKKNFQDSSGSSGIIMTPTRHTAHSLFGWIQSISSLRGLNIKAAVFLASGFSHQSNYMVQNDQNEVVEQFRQGFLNLLIFTSLAEEGLNLPECNVVVWYGPKTIGTSMTQARSRASAEDSCCSFFARSRWGESRREMTNETLEDLMNRAIKYVQDMPEVEYAAKIRDLQRASLAERMVQKIKDENKIKFASRDVRLDCRNCNNPVAHGDDLRLVDMSLHVNINQHFKDYYEEYTAPLDLEKKMENWVPGGSIRCRFCRNKFPPRLG
ncbi:ATP-dependent RNA helicase DHX58-like isoform X2 [Hyla sarda]|uniref:ATP-dependent RNA helicase DHX58-like isoform X2 n=1 Tax=Hyla sarda TaxID=327740 RepID=UPI0024C29036|nr:ATP-dependent RNA helicase DHX58-like isoform X2 [Hyla sarda]